MAGEEFATFEARSADSTASDHMVLEFMSWSGYVERPDVQAMTRVKAQAMGSRVVAIDSLGLGTSTSPIPEYWRSRIQQGDYRSVSRAQASALESVDLLVPDTRVSLVGHSQGAALAASFATQLGQKGIGIDRLILWETAGIRPQSRLSLLGKFASESLNWQRYLEDNPDWVRRLSLGQTASYLFDKANRPGLTDYPRGLTKARVIGDLLVAHDSGAIDDETEIIILHGAKSRVSSREDNQFLVTNLEQNGVKPAVWNTYDDESHGIIDSINRTHALFADFASD